MSYDPATSHKRQWDIVEGEVWHHCKGDSRHKAMERRSELGVATYEEHAEHGVH